MQYLRKFVVTLDFPRGNLHLRRRDSWQMPPEPMGVQALWLDDLLTVTQVDPGSPAARAAVQAGDIIVTLDGHDASCLDLGALTRLLRVRQGMPITMRVRRGIECLEITVPPSANVPCVEGGISTSSATR